jgi:hypothetical protein
MGLQLQLALRWSLQLACWWALQFAYLFALKLVLQKGLQLAGVAVGVVVGVVVGSNERTENHTDRLDPVGLVTFQLCLGQYPGLELLEMND